MSSPEEEPFILMKCAESPLGLGRAEDYQWHAEHPGESPTNDLVRELERRGYLAVARKVDEDEHRARMQAEITTAGRSRLDELARVTPVYGSA